MGREIDIRRQLSAEDELRAIIQVNKANIIRFQVIQISTILEKPYQVVRYDCAHGKPHMDRLYKKKPLKEYMDEKLPLKKLYEMAKNDIEANYKKYRQEYIKKMRNKK